VIDHLLIRVIELEIPISEYISGVGAKVRQVFNDVCATIPTSALTKPCKRAENDVEGTKALQPDVLHFRHLCFGINSGRASWVKKAALIT
jgi:hypothetical protein